MGACSSKNESTVTSPHGSPTDLNDVQPAVAGKSPQGSQDKPGMDTQRSQTKSGFKSDIETHHKGAHDKLAHLNHHALNEIYETADGAVLGRGACGVVCVVRRKDTGELYAMKTVTLDGMGGASLDELRKEVAIQRTLTHPNICRIFEDFEEPDGSAVHIIMELCTGGALVSRMKTHRHGYGERAAATLVEKMLSATLYCHHNGIVHRDIKLDNFIYENEDEEAELKLIDFGFAAEASDRPRRPLRPLRRRPAPRVPTPLDACARHRARPTTPAKRADARARVHPPIETRRLPLPRRWRPAKRPCGTSWAPPRTWPPSCGPSLARSTTRAWTCGPSGWSRTCFSRARDPSTTRTARRRRG